MKENYLDNALAGVFERFVARFIDRLLAILFAGTILVFSNKIETNQSIGFVIGILLPFTYLLTKDSLPFLNGQSIGKKLMRIRVIDYATGEAITGKYGKTVLREIVQWIPLLNFIDAVFIFSDTKQRLADKWVETQVVKL